MYMPLEFKRLSDFHFDVFSMLLNVPIRTCVWWYGELKTHAMPREIYFTSVSLLLFDGDRIWPGHSIYLRTYPSHPTGWNVVGIPRLFDYHEHF